MDEQGSSENMANETDSQPNISDQSVNVNNDVSSGEPVNQEMYSQEHVGKVAKTSRQKGFDKGYRTAQEEYGQQHKPVESASESDNRVGENHSVNMDEVRESVKQEMLIQKEVENFQKSAQSLIEKTNAFAEKHEDFNDKISHINFVDNVDFVKEVSGLDNSAEFLYHMADKPEKLGNLLIQLQNPATASVAKSAIKQISKQMQTNEASKSLHNTPSPRSSLKPSSVTGNMGVSHEDMLSDPTNMW